MEVVSLNRNRKRQSAPGTSSYAGGSTSSTLGVGVGSEFLGLSGASIRRRVGSLAQHQRASTLSMYNDAPQEEITLDEFETAGIDRLQGNKNRTTSSRRRSNTPTEKMKLIQI
jgi:hypothetical protein